MQKAVVMILNCCFTNSITYHDPLHGFRAGHDTGTATLYVKLLHKVAALREAVLYKIFLELQKAYGDLDRSRFLEILEGYDVGPRDLCFLRRFWEQLRMVERAGG